MSQYGSPVPVHDCDDFSSYFLKATKYEGTATSNADRSIWIPQVDLDKASYKATMTLDVPVGPTGGPESCTTTWGCESEECAAKKRNCGGPAEPGIKGCFALPNRDVSLGTAFYLQGAEEIPPPPDYKWLDGQSRYFKIPVVVKADELEIRRSTHSEAASGKVYEESDWGKMDRDRRIVDAAGGPEDESDTSLKTQGPQPCTAVIPSRYSRY